MTTCLYSILFFVFVAPSLGSKETRLLAFTQLCFLFLLHHRQEAQMHKCIKSQACILMKTIREHGFPDPTPSFLYEKHCTQQ
jgi:hypothetical protein